jgi:hypothetical protein
LRTREELAHYRIWRDHLAGVRPEQNLGRFAPPGFEERRDRRFHHIKPAMASPCAESFGGRARDELLAVELYSCLTEAQLLIADWRIDYNYHLPHSALQMMTPAAFGASLRQPPWASTATALGKGSSSAARCLWLAATHSQPHPNPGNDRVLLRKSPPPHHTSTAPVATVAHPSHPPSSHCSPTDERPPVIWTDSLYLRSRFVIKVRVASRKSLLMPDRDALGSGLAATLAGGRPRQAGSDSSRFSAAHLALGRYPPPLRIRCYCNGRQSALQRPKAPPSGVDNSWMNYMRLRQLAFASRIMGLGPDP